MTTKASLFAARNYAEPVRIGFVLVLAGGLLAGCIVATSGALDQEQAEASEIGLGAPPIVGPLSEGSLAVHCEGACWYERWLCSAMLSPGVAPAEARAPFAERFPSYHDGAHLLEVRRLTVVLGRDISRAIPPEGEAPARSGASEEAEPPLDRCDVRYAFCRVACTRLGSGISRGR